MTAQRPHMRTSRRGRVFPAGRGSAKDMSYQELKRRININPLDDTDGDGVPNYRDCKPLDRKRQDVSYQQLNKETNIHPLDASKQVAERKKKVFVYRGVKITVWFPKPGADTNTPMPIDERGYTYETSPVEVPGGRMASSSATTSNLNQALGWAKGQIDKYLDKDPSEYHIDTSYKFPDNTHH